MRRPVIACALVIAGIAAGARAGEEVAMPDGTWPEERVRALLDETLELRLAPDVSRLRPGERAALAELLAAGEEIQRLHERMLHPEADAARALVERLAAADGAHARGLADLFRLFKGPIAVTLENERVPFLPVAPYAPGKAVWPSGVAKEEVDAFLAAHPEEAAALLHPRTAVRRADAEALAADLATLDAHPALDRLHPGLRTRLEALAAAPDGGGLYAVPYAVAYADALGRVHDRLTAASRAIAAEDPDLASYLRLRALDLLTNENEPGDAAWVTGRFANLNLQLGAYETYDDALFGAKAFFGASVLLKDAAASAELERAVAGLQAIEDALPSERKRRVRSELPVGVYEVIADFGQARGANTASILPNEEAVVRRHGRTILIRGNVLRSVELFASDRRAFAAAVAPEQAEWLTPEGGFLRTLWHEIGHSLGPLQDVRGRPVGEALGADADLFEELKADLLSLFALHRLHEQGLLDDARLAAVRASGIFRVLQRVKPHPSQPYQRMQVMQMNWFLDRGVLEVEPDGRFRIVPERIDAAARAMLAEVLAIQESGDAALAAAFVAAWSDWRDDPHERNAALVRGSGTPRYRLVRYAALGE